MAVIEETINEQLNIEPDTPDRIVASNDLSFAELRLANLLRMRHESVAGIAAAHDIDPMELAETVITADRIAAAHGIDLAHAIKKWFDEAPDTER